MGEQAPELTPIAFRIVAAPEVGDTPALYSNFVQLSFTPHDFTLHFGWYSFPPLQEPTEGEVRVPVRPVATVAIPLNIARAMVSLFERQIRAWEEAFGQPVPDQPTASGAERPEEVAR